MKLVWTRPAAADRRQIRAYIAQRSPGAALALDELFQEKADKLASRPGIGHPGRHPGTRELVAHRHYVLVYDVSGEVLRILRVLHTAQQWPPQA